MSTDVFNQLKELPVRRYVDMLRNVVNDYTNKLDTSAAWDQYPGKKVPYCFSKMYGPFSMVASRHGPHDSHNSVSFPPVLGFTKLAPLVSPSVPLLPRGTNILTGRDVAFYWDSVDVFGYYSLTWATDPGLPVLDPPVVVPVNPLAPADIFDPVMERNGGAVMLQNFSNSLNPAIPAPATGTIVPLRGALLVDGETFTLDDGIHGPYVFEFDSNGAVVPGHYAVTFTALDTQETVRNAIVAAVNAAAGLNITATPATGGGGTAYWVNLVNDYYYSLGNVAITHTVANALFLVLGMAGGATSAFVDTVPHICFDIDLYDKKRGRSLTGERMPAQVLAGHTYDFKPSFGGREMRFDPDTEVEPRIYLNEVRMTEALDYSDAAYQAARVACYLNVIFKGTIVLQERG